MSLISIKIPFHARKFHQWSIENLDNFFTVKIYRIKNDTKIFSFCHKWIPWSSTKVPMMWILSWVDGLATIIMRVFVELIIEKYFNIHIQFWNIGIQHLREALFLLFAKRFFNLKMRSIYSQKVQKNYIVNTYSRSSSRSSSSRSSSSSKACYLQSLLHWHTMKYPTLWNIKGTLPLFRVLE